MISIFLKALPVEIIFIHSQSEQMNLMNWQMIKRMKEIVLYLCSWEMCFENGEVPKTHNSFFRGCKRNYFMQNNVNSVIFNFYEPNFSTNIFKFTIF
jgi:hypothetical protein